MPRRPPCATNGTLLSSAHRNTALSSIRRAHLHCTRYPPFSAQETIKLPAYNRSSSSRELQSAIKDSTQPSSRNVMLRSDHIAQSISTAHKARTHTHTHNTLT